MSTHMQRRGRMVWATDIQSATTTIPALITIPQVEILETGEDWETSTGIFTFTEDDLASAIASQDDPAVRTPVIKLGHTDPRFDGQPAIGRILNLSLTNNNQTLVGDYVGVPGWLGAVMASAYPRRSIEGLYDVTTRTGNDWPFVLTGLALLGTAYPAVNTLEDIEALWGDTPPVLYPVEELEEIQAVSRETSQGTYFTAFRKDDEMLFKSRNGEPVAAVHRIHAAVSVEDIRRSFYDTIGSEPGNYWWWVRAVLVEPAELIVDDDDGKLYRIDYSVGAGDAIILGEPQEVKIEYIDVAASTGKNPDGKPVRIAARWANAEEAKRPKRPEGSTKPSSSATVPGNEEVGNMKLSDEAIRKLGLDPATATDETVSAAILAQVNTEPDPGDGGEPKPETQPTTPATDPTATPTPAPEGNPPAETVPTTTPPAGTDTAPALPEGTVLVDAASWAQFEATHKAMAARLEDEAKAHRDRTIADAVRAGKIEKSRMEAWTKKWDADPDGTKQTLASLQAILPITELGEPGGEVEVAADHSAYPESWKSTVAATAKSTAGRVKVVSD